MRQVVPGGEDEQAGQQGEAGAEAVFLRARRHRPAADRLGQIEQQMPAIQHRDREQVDQPEIDRQHGDERDQAGQAELRHLAGQLRDAQRAAEVVGAALAGDHLRQAAEASPRVTSQVCATPPHSAAGSDMRSIGRPRRRGCRAARSAWPSASSRAGRDRRRSVSAPPRSTTIGSGLRRDGRRRSAGCPRTSRSAGRRSRRSGRRPAARPARRRESAITSPTTGCVTGRPTVANRPANSTTASRKLAIGPAATTIARDSTAFSWKVRPAIQLRPDLVRHVLGPFLAVQLHVAAERDPGDLPDGAAPVGPARPAPGRSRSRTPRHARRASARRGSGRARGRTRARPARRRRRRRATDARQELGHRG